MGKKSQSRIMRYMVMAVVQVIALLLINRQDIAALLLTANIFYAIFCCADELQECRHYRICEKCGAQIGRKFRVCPECGAVVRAADLERECAAVIEEEEKRQSQPSREETDRDFERLQEMDAREVFACAPDNMEAILAEKYKVDAEPDFMIDK